MEYVAEIIKGHNGRVLVRSRQVVRGNKFNAFLLKIRQSDPSSYKNIMAWMQLWAESGISGTNGAQWKFLDSKKGLLEWRPVPFRVVWFKDGADAVISHGFRKKSNKTPRSEITRGLKYIDTYFEAKESGEIKVQD